MGPLIASCTEFFHAYNLLQMRAHFSSEVFQSTHISLQIGEVVRVGQSDGRLAIMNNGRLLLLGVDDSDVTTHKT